MRLSSARPLALGRHDLLLLEVTRAGRPVKLVLRTYRHWITWWSEHDTDKAAREATALRQARHAGLPAPAVYAAGADWALVDWIDGEPLADREPVGTPAVQGARRLAEALAGLHAVPPPDGPFPRPSPSAVTETIRWWSDRIGNERLAQAIRRVVAPAEMRPAFIQGDPNRTNVLVNADHQVAALIDWEDAAVADPRLDVCRAASSLARRDPRLARAFLAAYEAACGEPIADLAQWQALLAVQRWTMIELMRMLSNRPGPLMTAPDPDDAERLLSEAGW